MAIPAWAEPPAAFAQWTRPSRLHAFAGLCALLTVYIFSIILWTDEPDIRTWEDGAIPISYSEEQWTTYAPVTAEQLEDPGDSDYIHPHDSDEFYLPVYPSSPSRSISGTPNWQHIPSSCLELILSDGASCTSDTMPEAQLDFVWTWVNSSDPVWHRARASISARLMGKAGEVDVDDEEGIAHNRNYDELRHSIRSVLAHFQPYIRQFTILTSDFASSVEESGLSPVLRLGQVPQWLNSTQDPSTWRDDGVRLRIQHHANLFKPYFETIFNNLAIESQFSNIQGVDDIFVYMNDDTYLLRNLKPADFFTSAFGFVFRLEYWTQVPPTLDANPERGEWQGLRQSNVFIGERFGSSTRPYRAHMPKIMSVSLLREMSETFPEAFARTASRPMHAVWTDGAPGDVHPGFMFVHFVVERWREGLLWSWAVARMGGDDDEWDAASAWAELHGDSEQILVEDLTRDSLFNPPQQLRAAGYEGPEASQYYFSSMDGYPYLEVRQNGTLERPNVLARESCTISRAECFPSWISSASEAFNHIAFANPFCGDCIINRLVQNSGRRGLSAVLPASDRIIATKASGITAETLPRVPSWKLGAFALADVLSQEPNQEVVHVREWTLRMLNRYRFVLADSPYLFARLNHERNAHSQLDRLDGHEMAFACVNDDVESDEDAVAVEGVMREWQETRWGTPATWETT
ncbi:unnamed protein product [Peniophora sp. CBMAI 1063]|nr:unnamed protein product [Peniophora sp. CBMAI 1063]